MPKRAKTRHTKETVVAAITNRRGKLYLAAADLGITSQTLRNYTKRWKDVRRAIAEAKGKMLDTAEDKLFKAIDKGEAWAICFFLKCQGKRRGYVERQEYRHGGDTGAPPVRVDAEVRHTQAREQAAFLDSLPEALRLQLLEELEKQEAERPAQGNGHAAAPTPQSNGTHTPPRGLHDKGGGHGPPYTSAGPSGRRGP